jgi:hypothetical protein
MVPVRPRRPVDPSTIAQPATVQVGDEDEDVEGAATVDTLNEWFASLDEGVSTSAERVQTLATKVSQENPGMDSSIMPSIRECASVGGIRPREGLYNHRVS